jgi:hypothetical protein
MALNIPTGRPLRNPAQLLGLVQAIRGAAPSDGKHWLEWKCGPQLTERAGHAIASRFISRRPTDLTALQRRRSAVAPNWCSGSSRGRPRRQRFYLTPLRTVDSAGFSGVTGRRGLHKR